MRVRIVSESGDCGDASITLEDGTPLRSVSAVTLRMEVGKMHTANLTFIVPKVDCSAIATVSEEHLHELAAAHGFELVKSV